MSLTQTCSRVASIEHSAPISPELLGECEVGKEIAEEFSVDLPKWWNPYSLIGMHPDSSGCSRPVTIYKSAHTEDLSSVAIYLSRKPKKRELKLMMDRALRGVEIRKVIDIMWKYGDKWTKPKIHGFRLVEQRMVVNTIEQMSVG